MPPKCPEGERVYTNFEEVVEDIFPGLQLERSVRLVEKPPPTLIERFKTALEADRA